MNASIALCMPRLPPVPCCMIPAAPAHDPDPPEVAIFIMAPNVSLPRPPLAEVANGWKDDTSPFMIPESLSPEDWLWN